MRRKSRRQENEKNRNMIYIGGSILTIGLLAFAITFVLYGNKMDKQAKADNQKIASLVQESAKESEQVSTQMGKTVEESKNVIENTITKTNNTMKEENTTKTQKTENTIKKEDKKDTTSTKTTKKQETTKDKKAKAISFVRPVEGEIIKNYAKDKLVYSETLEEWTTHLGWDIKADKTTVVKASCDGKIKSIKNDPRYGLSIIIEHQDGYTTLYASLLSTEFVKVGEEVKQGQSIGTVGDTAAFEIADKTHLHFEVSKNGECIDPNQVIK